MGTHDYESDYSIEQRREWDLFILFLVRHIRWPSDYADDHVCWLNRHGYTSPSEWMGDKAVLKEEWRNLLVATKDLDRLAINKLVGEEDKALRAELAKAGRKTAHHRPSPPMPVAP
jgi:hypothetical protein